MLLLKEVISNSEINSFEVETLNEYNLVINAFNDNGNSKNYIYENIMIINKLPNFENLSYNIISISHNSRI